MFSFQGKILVGTKDSEIIEITEKTASSQVILNFSFIFVSFLLFCLLTTFEFRPQISTSRGKFALVSKNRRLKIGHSCV